MIAFDASYASCAATACDFTAPKEKFEHLENPMHTFRQINILLEKGALVFLTTPNASRLWSRLRFFFAGQMAIFTFTFAGNGHITPSDHLAT